MQADVSMVALAEAEHLCIGVFCSWQWLWADASVRGKAGQTQAVSLYFKYFLLSLDQRGKNIISLGAGWCEGTGINQNITSM